MSLPEPRPARPLPWWLAAPLGLVVAGHVAAVLLNVLASSSGPWPTQYGVDMAEGPAFALLPGQKVNDAYLRPLKLAHNGHHASNRPGAAGATLEVRLKDESGTVVKTLRFPDREASFWVRHRQSILAFNLAGDQPVATPGGEVIPAPDMKARVVDVWEMQPDKSLALREVPEHLLPRDRPVYRPSEWSRILARSYGRHLCRAHGAASAEVIRHTRESALPQMVLIEQLPPDVFQELVTHFGEVRK